jgi:hypothetical protein
VAAKKHSAFPYPQTPRSTPPILYPTITALNSARSSTRTMVLLDLPPEIFKHIISDVVAKVGVVGAWKLRAVCCKCIHFNLTVTCKVG